MTEGWINNANYRKAIADIFYANLNLGLSSNVLVATASNKIDNAILEICGYTELQAILNEFPQKHYEVKLMSESESE